MKKMMLLVAVLAVYVSSVNATVLYDDFETYYDPGAIRAGNGGDSHANPDVWAFTGNSNWSRVTNNGDTANDTLMNVVGTQTYRDSEIMTISDDFGFNTVAGRSYSVDVASHYQGTNDQPINMFGVMGQGSNWYGADYAIVVAFNYNYLAIWVRDSLTYNGWGATRNLYKTNYAGVIDSINIELNDTSYDVVIEGHEGDNDYLGLWNTTGSLSGDHGFSESDMEYFENAKIFLAMESRNSAISGMNIEWDNVASAPVPEPATLAILGIGALGLLRKRS